MANGGQFSIELTGFRELEARLRSYGPRVYDRTVRAALARGARPIVSSARANVPVRTGLLQKSLGAVLRTNRRRQSAIAVIGPRRGFAMVTEDKLLYDPARTAWAVEFGHGGPAPAGPHPFLRPAFEGAAGTAQAAIIQRLREGVEKEANRA